MGKRIRVRILSARETEVARLLLRKQSYRDIARSMGISENTLKTHIKHIYRKKGIRSRKELEGRLEAAELEAVRA